MQEQDWIDLIRAKLNYDPITGLVSRVIPTNRKTRHKSGEYVRITLNYRNFRAHTLAFILMNGHFPEREIDHINRVRDDNRWCNLREVDHQTNMLNKGSYKNNKTGAKGVTYIKGKYLAQINRKGFPYWSNTSDSLEEAVYVREQELVRRSQTTTTRTQDTCRL